MREKTDKSKLKSGRGIITHDSFEAWRTARESKSIGTAVVLYDPIQRRSVNLLSQAEHKVFWFLRWHTDGAIYEQFPMLDVELVNRIRKEMNLPINRHILSTDFFVESPTNWVAVSVKANSSAFTGKKGETQKRRLEVEKTYWGHKGVDHLLVYGDDIPIDYVGNIKDIMWFYPEDRVKDSLSKMMHMAAHKAIVLPIKSSRLPFKKIANAIGDEKINALYEDFKRREDDSAFKGWRLDLLEGKILENSGKDETV